MANTIKKIVVLTSGGDAPGMNAAVRAVVRRAINAGIEVYGSENGYQGLVERSLKPLDKRAVANTIQRGGTLLKTKRVRSFHQQKVRDACRAFLAEKKIDAVIVLGGNGSFTGATLLSENNGPRVVGIPCTIDNDINGTDYCIGFDTACNTALNAVDKIRDTALSLDRHFIIEVMGRSSGFIAVEVGIAVGAEHILIPEYPVPLPDLAASIIAHRNEKLTSIIVAAEADQPGRSVELAKKIEQMTNTKYHVCILGHTQRGGTPTVKDRLSASLMGAAAVEALLAGQSNVMIALRGSKIEPVPFYAPKEATRHFCTPEMLSLNQLLCH